MHHAWLTIGWEAMLNMAPGERDYLMPTPADDYHSAKYSELTHQDASAASLRILSVLGDPLGRSTSLLLFNELPKHIGGNTVAVPSSRPLHLV